jgi:transposase-like protein
MDTKRKSYTSEYKLKVVLESMQRDTTQEEVCKNSGVQKIRDRQLDAASLEKRVSGQCSQSLP